jgi:hypothetical protein
VAYKCPKCSENIEEAVAKSALDAKANENTQLKGELKTAQDKAKLADDAARERDEARAEITKRDQAAERSSAFTELGIPETVRGGFEVIYGSEMAGVEQPVPFKDWLTKEETKAHPLLGAHYKAQTSTGTGGTGSTTGTGQGARTGGTGQGGTTGTGTQRASGGLVHVDKGAGDPGSASTPKTAAEVQKYLRSPEYRALPLDKQKEQLANLKAQTTQK